MWRLLLCCWFCFCLLNNLFFHDKLVCAVLRPRVFPVIHCGIVFSITVFGYAIWGTAEVLDTWLAIVLYHGFCIFMGCSSQLKCGTKCQYQANEIIKAAAQPDLCLLVLVQLDAGLVWTVCPVSTVTVQSQLLTTTLFSWPLTQTSDQRLICLQPPEWSLRSSFPTYSEGFVFFWYRYNH